MLYHRSCKHKHKTICGKDVTIARGLLTDTEGEPCSHSYYSTPPWGAATEKGKKKKAKMKTYSILFSAGREEEKKKSSFKKCFLRLQTFRIDSSSVYDKTHQSARGWYRVPLLRFWITWLKGSAFKIVRNFIRQRMGCVGWGGRFQRVNKIKTRNHPNDAIRATCWVCNLTPQRSPATSIMSMMITVRAANVLSYPALSHD